MTVLLRTLRACLRRAVFSVNFITAVFAAFSVLALESTGLYTQGGDVLYYLGLALNGGSAAVLMVCVFSTLPFSTSFATDWAERSFRFWSVRCGLRVYALTKIAACAVSGFLTSFLGMALFTAAFCARFPLFSFPSVGNAYSVYLIHGRPYAYLLLLMTHISLSSSVFAVLALLVSTFFPNRYTAAVMPVVLYMIAIRLSECFALPAPLDLSNLVVSVYNAGTPARSILLKLTLTAGLLALFGWAACRRLIRLVRHD